MLVALEVDIRGLALHRIGQDTVDQLDDGRFVDRGGERRGADVFLGVLEHLDVVGVVDVLEKALERIVLRVVVAVDRVAQRVLPGDDGEDVVARDELQVVDDAEVCGVGHGDRERATFALEGEDEVLCGELAGDELDDALIDLEVGEIDGRHPVLAREHARELHLGDEAELHEVVAYAHAGGLLLLERAIERFAGDQPLANEQLTDTLSGSSDGYGHR